MRTPIRVTFVLGAVLLAASVASAQTISTTPREPARWDAGGAVGWFAGNKEGLADEWNDWYDTFAASLAVGRYWTTHLKTEAAATFTNEGSVYGRDALVIPGQPYPIFRFREHHFGMTAISAAAVYQFLENAWVHPFVSAGVSLGWERDRSIVPGQVLPAGGLRPLVIPASTETRHVSMEARPVVGGGLKCYTGERVFIRTDVGALIDAHGVSHVIWRIGVGTDF